MPPRCLFTRTKRKVVTQRQHLLQHAQTKITYTHFSFCTAAEVGGKITYTQAHTHTSTGANKKRINKSTYREFYNVHHTYQRKYFWETRMKQGKIWGRGELEKQEEVRHACMHTLTHTPQCKRVGMGARIITLCCTADWHASAARSVCSVGESCPAACALSSGGRLARLRWWCRQVLAPAWSQ